MENSEQNLFSLLKRVEKNLYQKNELPLVEGFSTINPDRISTALKKAFGLSTCTLRFLTQKFTDKNTASKGYDRHTEQFPFTLSPITSTISLMIHKQDTMKLTQEVCQTKGFLSPNLQKGFLQFFLSNVIDQLIEEKILEGTSPKFSDEPLDQDAFIIDYEIDFGKGFIPFRLALTESFRKGWNTYFAQHTSFTKTSDFTESLELPLSIVMGSASFKPQEFAQLHEGDLILLDKTYYDSFNHKGSLRIYLDNTCLFRAKINDNKIKLFEYSLHHEDINMSEQSQDPKENQNIESIEDISLEIKVEVDRFVLPLSKIKELQPGNYLPLSVTPGQGVSLMIHNQRIGKGELILLKDKLGLRVTEISNDKKNPEE